MERLRVVVLTQEDRFFIPKNIKKLSQVCDIMEIVNIKHKSSLENKVSDFLKWFGFFQVAKMGLLTINRAIESAIDNMTGFRYFGGECSIKDAAKLLKVPYSITHNVNSKEFLEKMRSLQPDLIVSYSAPQVFKPPLLAIPKYGVINVHGSYLPNYRGCLPSFWQLYHDEKYAGATVHYMSEKIDDGDIIIQGQVDISDCKTMFEVMNRTKELGGNLLLEAVKKISSGQVERKKNDTTKGQYFSWPTIEDARNFRRKGKKLI